MSYCNDCTKFRTLPSCMTNLTIGTFTGNNNASVYVYLMNHTTGYLYRISGTTNGSGVLAIDITDGGDFMPTPKHDYELYVTLQSATNTDERLTFTISSVNYTCAAIDFNQIWNEGDELAAYTNQTLKAA